MNSESQKLLKFVRAALKFALDMCNSLAPVFGLLPSDLMSPELSQPQNQSTPACGAAATRTGAPSQVDNPQGAADRPGTADNEPSDNHLAGPDPQVALSRAERRQWNSLVRQLR